MTLCTWATGNEQCLHERECAEAMQHQRASFYDVCLKVCERMEEEREEARNEAAVGN